MQVESELGRLELTVHYDRGAYSAEIEGGNTLNTWSEVTSLVKRCMATETTVPSNVRNNESDAVSASKTRLLVSSSPTLWALK